MYNVSLHVSVLITLAQEAHFPFHLCWFGCWDAGCLHQPPKWRFRCRWMQKIHSQPPVSGEEWGSPHPCTYTTCTVPCLEISRGREEGGGGAMPSVLPFPASLNAPQIAEHNTKHNLPVKGSGLIANYNLLSCNVTICSAGV